MDINPLPGQVQCIATLKRAASFSANLFGLLFFCALAIASYQSFLRTRSILGFGLIIINGLFLVFFLGRRKAQSITDNPLAWFVGFGSILLPLLLRPVAGEPSGPLSAIGLVLQLLGAGLIIAALLSLRRSFGVVAAHRGIRTGGLYRWIRHPMYASELIFFLGFTLVHASLWNGCIWVAVAIFQVLRAHFEEELLARDPMYRSYRRRCRYRFLPGLW